MPLLPNKQDCCGCTACSQICARQAITMKPDKEGFLYPEVDCEKCVECQLCTNVCPILHYDNIPSKEATPLKIWGMQTKKDDVYSSSSSGGVFSELASYVIGQSGVVYGAVYDDNMKVLHTRIDSEKDIHKLRGSKYVQSELGDVFKRVKMDLVENRLVLFSGTGCQIEGLRLFLRKEYASLITIDLVCHGVPSPKLYADYIHFLEEEYHAKVIDINMRDKTKGWKQRFHYRIKFDNGIAASQTEIFDTRKTNIWNVMFFSECITRPSCHVCRFANYLRPSDITIADFWGVQKSHPDFYNGKGVSLVMANTDRGKNIVEAIKDSFRSIETTKEKSSQPCLHTPVHANPLRSKYWEDVDKLTFRQLIKKYHRYGFFDYYWHYYRMEFHSFRVRLLSYRKNQIL